MQERRRYNDRRILSTQPSADRRRAERRRLVLSAGLLAALAAVAPKVNSYVRGFTPFGDYGLVEVATPEFRLPGYDPAVVDPMIREAAAAYGVSAELVRAVIQAESAFNPVAISPVGALGLMQLMPVTATSLGVEDPLDPRQNIFGGVKYLSKLLDRFDGNVALALAGYNAGPTAVARHRGIPPYRETRGYVKKIRDLLADTRAAFKIPEPPRPKRVVRAVKSRRPVSKASSRKAASARSAKTTVKKASLRTSAKKKTTVRKAVTKSRTKSRTPTRTLRASRTPTRKAVPVRSRTVRRSTRSKV